MRTTFFIGTFIILGCKARSEQDCLYEMKMDIAAPISERVAVPDACFIPSNE
jgi:hypothetical protein